MYPFIFLRIAFCKSPSGNNLAKSFLIFTKSSFKAFEVICNSLGSAPKTLFHCKYSNTLLSEYPLSDILTTKPIKYKQVQIQYHTSYLDSIDW